MMVILEVLSLCFIAFIVIGMGTLVAGLIIDLVKSSKNKR